jgi:hypothetical protein
MLAVLEGFGNFIEHGVSFLYFADRISGAVVHLTTDGKRGHFRASGHLTTMQLQSIKRQNARISKLTQAFQSGCRQQWRKEATLIRL